MSEGPDRHMLREIRTSELELRMNKDHPAYIATRQLLEEEHRADIGMTVLINYGNIAGLTLGYKLRQINAQGAYPGITTLWVPQNLPGPGDFSYMVQNFRGEQ